MNRRRPFVGGNWKMNTNRRSACELAKAIDAELRAEPSAIDVAIFPPCVYLDCVGESLRAASSDVALGAQDMCDQPDGAFTGAISADMLVDLGVQNVLAGHSERRHVFGEDDALVNRKVKAALDAGLTCVLCVGETLEQRERGETDAVNERQTSAGLQGVSASQLDRLVIAYEPVWAIGTGRAATIEDAQQAHEHIRSIFASLYSQEQASSLRIIYGGSVNSDNATGLFAAADVDGGLIGGASLGAESFLAICRAADATQRNTLEL